MSIKNIVPIGMRSEIECVQDIIITPEESIVANINHLQSGLNLRRAPYSWHQLNSHPLVFHLKM